VDILFGPLYHAWIGGEVKYVENGIKPLKIYTQNFEAISKVSLWKMNL
jgi:hypothetical protein